MIITKCNQDKSLLHEKFKLYFHIQDNLDKFIITVNEISKLAYLHSQTQLL